MAGSGDEQLSQDLARGRREAFAALYDQHAPQLYRAARALLDNSHDAEDAVQAVFVGLVRSRTALTKIKNWPAYLLTALRHEAARLGMRRRQQRDFEPIGEADLSAPLTDDSAAAKAAKLELALAMLPEDQRQVVRLKTEAGLTFAEIGNQPKHRRKPLSLRTRQAATGIERRRR